MRSWLRGGSDTPCGRGRTARELGPVIYYSWIYYSCHGVAPRLRPWPRPPASRRYAVSSRPAHTANCVSAAHARLLASCKLAELLALKWRVAGVPAHRAYVPRVPGAPRRAPKRRAAHVRPRAEEGPARPAARQTQTLGVPVDASSKSASGGCAPRPALRAIGAGRRRMTKHASIRCSATRSGVTFAPVRPRRTRRPLAPAMRVRASTPAAEDATAAASGSPPVCRSAPRHAQRARRPLNAHNCLGKIVPRSRRRRIVPCMAPGSSVPLSGSAATPFFKGGCRADSSSATIHLAL